MLQTLYETELHTHIEKSVICRCACNVLACEPRNSLVGSRTREGRRTSYRSVVRKRNVRVDLEENSVYAVVVHETDKKKLS